jgi:hypothetical protein
VLKYFNDQDAVYGATLSLKINFNNTNPKKFERRRHKKSSPYVGRALLESYIYLVRIISANLSFPGCYRGRN